MQKLVLLIAFSIFLHGPNMPLHCNISFYLDDLSVHSSIDLKVRSILTVF